MLYRLGFFIATILGIINIIKISENRENRSIGITNFTKVGYYFNPSKGLYGGIHWDKDWNGKIKRKSLFPIFALRVLLMPWFSRISVIIFIYKIISDIKYDSNKPEKLKEIEAKINSHDYNTDEMRDFILKINEIHYGDFLPVPVLERRTSDRIFVDDSYWSVREGKGFLNSEVMMYGDLKENDDYFTLDDKTICWSHGGMYGKHYSEDYEYKIEGTKVLYRCLSYRDHEYEEWRGGNDYRPIDNGVVDEDAIEYDITSDAKKNWVKLKGKELEKEIKKKFKEDLKHYEYMVEWHEIQWNWVNIYILSQYMPYEKFVRYIKGEIKRIKDGVRELDDLCEEYGGEVHYDAFSRQTVTGIKSKKKSEELGKKYDEIFKANNYLRDPKRYIKIFENILEYVEEDQKNKAKGSKFVKRKD